MSGRQASRVSLIWLLLIGTSACTSIQPVTESSDWAARRSVVLALDSWELKGRIAIKHDAEGGQARLRWQQVGESSHIHLAGPFGAGGYDLVWEPEYVSVSDASGEQSVEYQGKAAGEAFLTDQLGWSFPAGSLRYWVLGVLDPAAGGQEHFDEAGLLTGLEQYGWQISYERYADDRGINLPTRIRIENEQARLRIVVSKWSIPEASG